MHTSTLGNNPVFSQGNAALGFIPLHQCWAVRNVSTPFLFDVKMNYINVNVSCVQALMW